MDPISNDGHELPFHIFILECLLVPVEVPPEFSKIQMLKYFGGTKTFDKIWWILWRCGDRKMPLFASVFQH